MLVIWDRTFEGIVNNMYENIFSQNFVLNFFYVFLFLISNIFFSICIGQNKVIKKIFFFKEFQSIVIFFLVFCLYTFILNVIVISDYKNLSIIIFLIFFLQIFYLLKNLKNFKLIFNLDLKVEEKFILLIFFILYLISILPLSDADSISIYQYIPSTIYSEGLKEIDLVKNLEFTLLSNTEILLLFSAIFKSDNLGAQLNLLTLFFFIIVKFKDHKNFSLIIFSSPLIIYFISAQKLQLFFGLIFLLLFILINRNIFKKKVELFILILLLVFYSSGKFSYILFTIPLYIYFFYRNLNYWKYIILYSSLSFIIVYVPLLSIKQIYFYNIFAPFFDNFLGQGLEAYNAFAFSIRSSEGWISDPTNISLYVRPFVSLEIGKLSSSLGLIFLLMFFNPNLQKKTNYFPFLIVILVILTGQILPRYYFEAFLLLAFFYKPKNYFIKLVIYLQVLIIFSISLLYIFISYIQLGVLKNKTDYMNRFSYSFFNSQQIKKDDLNGNIFDYSLGRQSIFFDKNIYSPRYLDILYKYSGDYNKKLSSFIDENSIDYIILESIDEIPKCILTKEINKTFRKKSVRNFLVKNHKIEYKILEIEDNKCNNIIK